MVTTYDDKNSAYAERRVSNINVGFEADNDEDVEDKGVCYNCVKPDKMENGIIPVASPNFRNIAVVDSTNVHFGNKTYYQGPVTVLKQTIVSPSEVLRTNGNETLGLPPKEGPNGKTFDKIRLALCPGSKRRQLIAAGVAVTAALLVLSIYLSIAFGRMGRTRKNSGLGDTGDGTPAGVYNPSKNGSNGNFLDGNNLRIRERGEWLAQPPVQEIKDLKTPVPNVIISHSATEGCYTTAECVIRVRYIQMFHIESKGWSDIGYNFLVGGEGAVYEGRGWDKVGAHSLGWNDNSIGICVVGTFTTIEPTPKQLAATQKLIDRAVKLGKITKDYRLLAHNQVQSTESPGRIMFAIMQNWPHWYNTSVLQD